MTTTDITATPGRSVHRHKDVRALVGEATAIFRLSTPIALVSPLNVAMSVTDTVMAVGLGTGALAAVAVGSDFYSVVFYLVAGVVSGIGPYYAAAVAGGDAERAFRLRVTGWLVIVFCAVLALPVVWFAPLYLGAVGLDAGLNYVLMFGLAGWPGLGILGAGLSSLFVASFMARYAYCPCPRARTERGVHATSCRDRRGDGGGGWHLSRRHTFCSKAWSGGCRRPCGRHPCGWARLRSPGRAAPGGHRTDIPRSGSVGFSRAATDSLLGPRPRYRDQHSAFRPACRGQLPSASPSDRGNGSAHGRDRSHAASHGGLDPDLRCPGSGRRRHSARSPGHARP